MARALLDTDILSEVFRGKNESVRRHAETYLSQHGQLFVTTPERQQIHVHDLRGTFVTVSLANSRSESWISALTWTIDVQIDEPRRARDQV